MARNRQRARDRKASRENPLHHENVPGELDHASGEVEEFDATLIQGADGEPTDVDEAELEAAAVEAAPPPPPAGRRPTDEDDDEDEGPRRRPTGPKPGGNRVLNFLRASWAELQRVQWPDRRQVAQATAVVLGFVAVAGAYLGLADAAAQKIVDYIL
jgi:preprotein translocase SecE subunit